MGGKFRDDEQADIERIRASIPHSGSSSVSPTFPVLGDHYRDAQVIDGGLVNQLGQCPACNRVVRLTTRQRIKTHVTAKQRCAGMGLLPVAGTVRDAPAPGAATSPVGLSKAADHETGTGSGPSHGDKSPGVASAKGKRGRLATIGGLAAALVVTLVLVAVTQSGGAAAPAGPAAPSTSAVAIEPTAIPTVDAAAEESERASAEASRSSAAAVAAQESAAFASMRGLVRDLAWWNANFPAAPISECQAAGEWEYWEQPGPNASAWHLPSGDLVCADPALTAWDGHIVVLDVFFAKPVAEAKAVSIASTLLPADAYPMSNLAGHNADYSRVPGGSCMHFSFSSHTLWSTISALDSTWSNASLAEISLYTHLQTAEGADTAYRPDSIHQASISLGVMAASNPDGTANC